MTFNTKAKVKPMKDKKNQKVDAMVGNKAFDFVGGIKAEFKKISWTDREDLRTYTKIVVGATFTFGMLVFATDLVIQKSLGFLDGIFKLIIG